MSLQKKIISYKRFNPNFHHLKMAMNNPLIRFIFLYGGSSSAKSFSVAQATLLDCLSSGNNTLVFRKVGASISESIYRTFELAAKTLKIYDAFQWKENYIVCLNGAEIVFKGLDDPEKIKGLESFRRVICEELTEFDEADFRQICKRLRGMEGQQIICMFNPISELHWIKKNIFDREELEETDNHLYGILKDNINGGILPKEYSMVTKKWINKGKYIINPKGKEEYRSPDTVIIKSTYLNNFWVVGSPDGTYGFYDQHTIADFDRDKKRDYNYYRIYALGDWGSIKTGGEFLYALDLSKHTGAYSYNKDYPVHISVDNNVLPYISVTFWQYIEGNIRQIHEICASEPFNTVTKASEMARIYLNSIGYDDVVYIYGDASTKAGNTIDDEKRTFLDKFIEGIELSYRTVERVPKANPSVAMTGEFINCILSGDFPGISIGIDESCKTSIFDYENVKKDVNGSILKTRKKNKVTGQTYEEFGHITDTLRYFVYMVLKKEYDKFSLRRKHNKTQEKGMNYYDKSKLSMDSPVIMEIHPGINNKYMDVRAILKDERIYILSAHYKEYLPEIKEVASYISEGDNVHMELNLNMSSLLKELRTQYSYDIRGRKEVSDKIPLISAYLSYIQSNIYFPADYDSDSEMSLFINGYLDYKDKNTMESVYILARIAQRFCIQKK